MTYTTIKYQGQEMTLADFGVSSWNRTTQNQGKDEIQLTLQQPMDAPDLFPYGALVIVQIGRIASRANPLNPTLPASNNDRLTNGQTAPALTFSGGKQWFWGYCLDNDRAGDPSSEAMVYKFVGPYQFFFDFLVFQKLQLSYNGVKQVADWQSEIILGLSLTSLSGPNDEVPGSTTTNVMTVAQQLKEIMGYAQNDSAYQQSNNGLGWPLGAQFQCDRLTTDIDGVNFDLLKNPSANVLIQDYYGSLPDGEFTSASVLPAGSYMLRAPLDSVNAATCGDCMKRQLQWLGGIGTPTVWTDHTTTPPTIRIGTRENLPAVNLPLSGINVRNRIKNRTDLLPPGVHFKYQVTGSFNGEPTFQVINDVAAYLHADGTPGEAGAPGVSLYEGTGNPFALYDINHPTTMLPTAIQNGLAAASKTAGSMVQTIDFQGAQTSSASSSLTTIAFNPVNPAGTGGDGGFWGKISPELADVTGLIFYANGNPGVVVKDTSGNILYQNNQWTGTIYANCVIDGVVTQGMIDSQTNSEDPDGGATIRAIITAPFGYGEVSRGQTTVAGVPKPTIADQGKVSYALKEIPVLLTNLSGGEYVTNSVQRFAEPIPYGLAGYILALESIPQYEGSILVQEQEITDVCPLGNVLNITGGLTEWATMAACVQAIRYGDNGQTEITFGPAKHLNASQFVARFRNNLGPRWYNQMPANPANTAGVGSISLAKNIPANSSNTGAKNYTFLSFLGNIASQQGPAGNAATLARGAFIDSGAAPSPFTGAVPTGATGFGQGPSLVLASGPSGINSGESQAWIRLSVADFNGAIRQMFAQEVDVCVVSGGSNVPKKMMILCTAPY